MANLVVCNPRKNALLKDGNKSDHIDARKLAELLRGGYLKPVYHGETGVRMLRELARGSLTIVQDLTRVMNRLKAVYLVQQPVGPGCAARLSCKALTDLTVSLMTSSDYYDDSHRRTPHVHLTSAQLKFVRSQFQQGECEYETSL